MTFCIPRPMLLEDEEQVRAIFAVCHPDKYPQPDNWYFAHPTLVVAFSNNIVAFTSFTVVVLPGHGPTLYGEDICVHPDYRRNNIAKALHTARLVIGRSVGAKVFMGVTHKENRAVISVLARRGAHVCLPLGNDVLLVGPIAEV